MSAPGRTRFQETLLGTDAGSRMAWTLWRQGYERGAQSGWSVGYVAGIADMLGAADEFRQSHQGVWKLPTHAEVEAQRNTVRGDVDTRTPEQIALDTHASWAADTDMTQPEAWTPSPWWFPDTTKGQAAA